LTGWDGAAGIVRGDGAGEPKKETPGWISAYYRDVVVADERRFLVSEAQLHYKRVGPGRVNGERRVVMQDGKCMIQVGDEVWRVWREYEARGREEQQEQQQQQEQQDATEGENREGPAGK
jgi:hypothetical protein